MAGTRHGARVPWSNGLLEGDARDAPEAEAGHDGPADRLGVLEGEDDVELREEALPIAAVERLARAGARLAHDPLGGAQIGVAQGALLRASGGWARRRPRARRRATRTHLEIGVLDLALDQVDVDLEVCHPPRDLLRVGHGERGAWRRCARGMKRAISGATRLAGCRSY